MDTQKKDFLSVEESKPTETSDMLASITDNSILQNSQKLEEKVIDTLNNKIATTKFWENEKEFFQELKMSKKELVKWIKEKKYMVKGDNNKYMATEWCEKNGYAINQKVITIIFDPVLMNNNSLGYIPTNFWQTYCGYFTEKGKKHIMNELKKERKEQEND